MSNTFHIFLLTTLLLTVAFAQIDNKCMSVTCPTGYQCQSGRCVQPRKKLCSLDFNLVPIRCTDRNYKCNNAKNSPSCGFSTGGVKKDFLNACFPCLDNTVSFYYRVPCSRAPKVCV